MFLQFFISCSKTGSNVIITSKDSVSVPKSNLSDNTSKSSDPLSMTDNVQQKSSTGFNTYCNDRFDFCVQYPDILIKQPESTNGDGTSFISKDRSIKMSTWGSYGSMDEDYILSREGIEITYETKKKTFFVVTGWKNNGNGYYRKTKLIRSESGDIDHTVSFEFEFPKDRKPECAPMIEYIENHF